MEAKSVFKTSGAPTARSKAKSLAIHVLVLVLLLVIPAQALFRSEPPNRELDIVLYPPPQLAVNSRAASRPTPRGTTEAVAAPGAAGVAGWVAAALALTVAEEAGLVVGGYAAQSARSPLSPAPSDRRHAAGQVLPAPTKKYRSCSIATRRRSTGCTTGSCVITQPSKPQLFSP